MNALISTRVMPCLRGKHTTPDSSKLNGAACVGKPAFHSNFSCRSGKIWKLFQLPAATSELSGGKPGGKLAVAAVFKE